MINKFPKFQKKYFNGLINTGYTTKDAFNYTKRINDKHRFHAHIVGDYIEIHIDALNNGLHKVIYRPFQLEYEIKKIKRCCG